MVLHTGKDLEEQERLALEALRFQRVWIRGHVIRAHDIRERSSLYLDQQVQLGGPSLVQWRHAGTDQSTEALTQVQDLAEAVENLMVEQQDLVSEKRWGGAWL